MDRRTDVQLVERAIGAVSDLDIAEALRCVSDSFVLELPYRGGGFARTLTGADARAFFELLPKIFERMDFTDVVVHGSVGGVIVSEYRSNGLTKQGMPYPNTYAAFFEVVDGLIVRWREYFNPEVLTAAGLG